MPNLIDSDLSDPTPPMPGERERALVATRAHQLGRRRRIMQGVGALAVVAAVSVSVAALTAGGSGSGASNKIEAASSPETSDAPVTTEAPTTTVAPAPAPETAPAAVEETPTPATTQAPAIAEAPPAPSTFTVSGTIGNIPEGATVTISFTGPGGSFSAVANGSGHYSVSGLPAGTYDGVYSWESGDAAQAGRLGSVTIDGNSDISFTLP
jgi:hypothetical protein